MINNECVQEEKDYKIYNSLDAAISVALKIVVQTIEDIALVMNWTCGRKDLTKTL